MKCEKWCFWWKCPVSTVGFHRLFMSAKTRACRNYNGKEAALFQGTPFVLMDAVIRLVRTGAALLKVVEGKLFGRQCQPQLCQDVSSFSRNLVR